MNKYLEEAKAMLKSINGLAEGASDEKIVNNKDAFPWWNGNGVFYKKDLILRFADSVYRILQDHTSQNDWTPDVAVSLYVEISLEEWPIWKQPAGAHDAYALNAKCSHNGLHWISDYDGNIWEPGVFGWHNPVDGE